MDISEIIEKVSKQSGLKAYIGNSEELVVKKIPFGIQILDNCVGGGIPCGRISELVGDASVGKTFLVQQLIRSAQNMGLETIYFNVENKYDPLWFSKTGIDTEKLVVIQGNIGESVFDAIIQLIRDNIGLMIVDSIAALVPLAESEDEMAQSTMALQARMLSKGFRKILDPLSISRTALVFTNQLRSGMDKYTPDVYPGGRAQYFYSSLTIQVRRGEWITETRNKEEVRKGFRMEFKTVKNTLAPPWQEGGFPFLFSGSIDFVAVFCEMARDAGIIVKSGSWFALPNAQRVQGWDGLLEYYRNDGDALKELSQKLAEVE